MAYERNTNNNNNNGLFGKEDYVKLNKMTEDELIEVAKKYARKDWLTVSSVVYALYPDTEEQDLIDALIAEKVKVLEAKAKRQASF